MRLEVWPEISGRDRPETATNSAVKLDRSPPVPHRVRAAGRADRGKSWRRTTRVRSLRPMRFASPPGNQGRGARALHPDWGDRCGRKIHQVFHSHSAAAGCAAARQDSDHACQDRGGERLQSSHRYPPCSGVWAIASENTRLRTGIPLYPRDFRARAMCVSRWVESAGWPTSPVRAEEGGSPLGHGASGRRFELRYG